MAFETDGDGFVKRNRKDYPAWMSEKKNVQFLYERSKQNGVKASPITGESLEEIKKACKEILSWDYSYDRRRFKAIRKRKIENNPQHKESLETSLGKEQPDYGGTHQINKGIDETISIALAELRVLLENQKTATKDELTDFDVIAENLLKHVSAHVSAAVEMANNDLTKLAEKNRKQSAEKIKNSERAKKIFPSVLDKHKDKRNRLNLAYTEIAEELGVSVRTVQNYLKK
ncbi:hypothetical protein A3197_09785 [Candidatus Thiodiazotropha endoloripes]|nr:hypothetical protein A3197_09785 [Candidatus Thiodiazotropha endoloripes]